MKSNHNVDREKPFFLHINDVNIIQIPNTNTSKTQEKFKIEIHTQPTGITSDENDFRFLRISS